MKLSTLVPLMVVFSIMIISLNGVIQAAFHARYNRVYEVCKADLIAKDKYLNIQQAFDCARSDPTIQVLDFILSPIDFEGLE